MFKQGIDRGKRVKEVYDFIGWQNAVDRSLKLLKKGDLMLLQADTIDATVQYLQRAMEHENLGKEIDMDSALRNKDQDPARTMLPTKNPSKEQSNVR
jgi:cyanophycin synthetase